MTWNAEANGEVDPQADSKIPLTAPVTTPTAAYANMENGGERYQRNGNEAAAEEDEIEDWKPETTDLIFGINDIPPWMTCIMLGLQHFVAMFFANLTIPIILGPALCMAEDNVGKSEILGTLFVASGLITLAQNFFGVRLPVVQAGTFALMVPTLAYFDLPQWKCPDNIISTEAALQMNMTFMEDTNNSYIIMGSPEHREIWMTRLREVQGAIMLAALFEVVLGATGAVGLLLKCIGPLTIMPTITLLGLQMFKGAAQYAAKQWWICTFVILLMIIFSQFLHKINIPCLSYTRKEGWSKTKGYPLFKMFPILLSMCCGWFLCFCLTMGGAFPSEPDSWGYWARTDTRTDVIYKSPWIRFPYPCQWGIPTVSIAAVCAILSGILATTIESIGDYHACAKLAGAPPPPLHAVNRGIMVEGLGSLLDGLMGTGNGTTSTSINVGVVGLTKVGSRQVIQVQAGFMIFFGLLTKFGAIFVTIPDPVIGASFFILFGMIVAVGLSNLHYVDLGSSRNLFIIGFSLFAGLSLPEWIKANPGAINTGSPTFDSICQVLLSTGMFVGGMLGFTLDNAIPGTQKERGMEHWTIMREALNSASSSPSLKKALHESYDFPCGMSFINRWKWTSYIPICPTYGSKDEGGAQEEPLQNDEKL